MCVCARVYAYYVSIPVDHHHHHQKDKRKRKNVLVYLLAYALDKTFNENSFPRWTKKHFPMFFAQKKIKS